MSRQLGDDPVGRRIAQWSEALPDVDTAGMAILGRARWIVLRSRPAIEAVFAEHGLDAGEFDVIATLRRSGAPYRLRPTELFQALMISSGGLTDRLDRLSKAGLVRRLRAPEDGRSLLVELTEAGVVLAETAFRADMKVEGAMLAALTAEQRETLAALLGELAASLDAASA